MDTVCGWLTAVSAGPPGSGVSFKQSTSDALESLLFTAKCSPVRGRTQFACLLICFFIKLLGTWGSPALGSLPIHKLKSGPPRPQKGSVLGSWLFADVIKLRQGD